MEVWPGAPYPLGATFDGTGTNFALFSEAAERVELCLFDDDGDETRIELRRRRRLRVALLPAAGAAGPALRLPGARPVRPGDGQRCNPAKLLLDPYAKATRARRLGSVAVLVPLRRPDARQRRRLAPARDARRGHQPVLRLGRRPATRRSRTPRPSSTRPTSRG